MNRLLIIALAVLLNGCAVTLHGNQTVSGDSTSTTTGSSVRASTQAGNARFAASFGAPPAANAPGGRITFSNGASAVVVVALAIAGATELIGSWFTPAAERREAPAPGGISQTCSCYGWRPELLTPAPEPQ